MTFLIIVPCLTIWFHEEVLDLEEFWKDMGISRWHKIFRYKKEKPINFSFI
jgi:hypothetical protein